MIGSARNMLARPGSGERRIQGALSLVAQTPCDGRSKTSRHTIKHVIKLHDKMGFFTFIFMY